MPYKVSGKWVLVLREGRWIKFKRHVSEAAAKAHAAALNLNVTVKEKK
jgi:hypothetical protein